MPHACIFVFVNWGFRGVRFQWHGTYSCKNAADRKGASSRSSGNNDEGFEEFLEGMFP
jgi:hypothetical protein